MAVLLNRENLSKYKEYSESHSQRTASLIAELEKTKIEAKAEFEEVVGAKSWSDNALDKRIAQAKRDAKIKNAEDEYHKLWNAETFDSSHLDMTLHELACLDTFQDEIFELIENKDVGNWIFFSDVVRAFVNNQYENKTHDEMLRFLAILKRNYGYARRRLCGGPPWLLHTIGNHLALSKFLREMNDEFLKHLGDIRY